MKLKAVKHKSKSRSVESFGLVAKVMPKVLSGLINPNNQIHLPRKDLLVGIGNGIILICHSGFLHIIYLCLRHVDFILICLIFIHHGFLIIHIYLGP